MDTLVTILENVDYLKINCARVDVWSTTLGELSSILHFGLGVALARQPLRS